MNYVNSSRGYVPAAAAAAPTSDAAQILRALDQASFALDEVLLYLDTHPADPTALAYFREYSQLRRQALDDYAAIYGPLTLDTAPAGQEQWEWINQPWPWEGGAC